MKTLDLYPLRERLLSEIETEILNSLPDNQESNEIEIEFEKGEVVGFGGKKYDNSVSVLVALSKHIEPYAIGWDIHTGDRKSTRLNSSHTVTSYAVFCLKKKNG